MYIFVGYGNDLKGYRSFNPKTNQFMLSRDVIFEELVVWKLLLEIRASLTNNFAREIYKIHQQMFLMEFTASHLSKKICQ